MARDLVVIGVCPQCAVGELVCKYNHFEKAELSITSWEHKCAECGFRETTAFRSDDPVAQQTVDPQACPFCRRRGGV